MLHSFLLKPASSSGMRSQDTIIAAQPVLACPRHFRRSVPPGRCWAAAAVVAVLVVCYPLISSQPLLVLTKVDKIPNFNAWVIVGMWPKVWLECLLSAVSWHNLFGARVLQLGACSSGSPIYSIALLINCNLTMSAYAYLLQHKNTVV